MKVIEVVEKTVAQNEVVILNLCGNRQGDTCVGEVYVDLPEANSITVSASVDGEHWHVVKVMDMGNFTNVAAITAAGYYMIPAAGLAKVKLACGAAGTFVIKKTF